VPVISLCDFGAQRRELLVAVGVTCAEVVAETEEEQSTRCGDDSRYGATRRHGYSKFGS
jgi:hypothetical protein